MIDPSPIRWIFFDVGDTLLDEREAMLDWCAQVAAGLTRRGRRTDAQQVVEAREQAMIEFAPHVWHRLLEILGVPRDRVDVLEAASYPHALERPFVGTTDVVNRLSARYHLGVIANQSAGTADRLCNHGWRGKFSLCVSSTEENLKKPDPAIFRLALDRAGCRADQAVMIGDRVDNDIAPAKAIGMMTIRIRQGLSSKQEPANESQTPHVTVDRITDIPPLFRC